MIFDSHAHYNDSKFDDDRLELLAKMQHGGVGYIMNAADSIESIEKILTLCDKFPFFYASVGVHPENAGSMKESDIALIREYAKHDKVKAVGEIGLDYYYDDVPHEVQKKWFIRQCELAEELSLPVIIHDREAHGDTLEILKNYSKTGGVLHCFSGSCEMAKDVLSLGMYIAFGGTLTFKNARRTREVLDYVPLDRIMIETDSPYLAPEPYRGKRNSSLYLTEVISKISEIKGIPYDEVEKITTENAKNCFNI